MGPPVGGWQWPPLHVAYAGQAFPQAPQLLTSVSVSVVQPVVLPLQLAQPASHAKVHVAPPQAGVAWV